MNGNKVINFNKRLEKKQKGMTREEAIELLDSLYEASDTIFDGLDKLTEYIREDIGSKEFVNSSRLVGVKQFILLNGLQTNNVLNTISEYIKGE